MQLQFLNKHIFFALDTVWNELDYRFKNYIHELVSLNSDNEYLQTINIDPNTLVFLVQINTYRPEGIAMSTNKAILESLTIQLTQLANNGDSEAIDAISKIQSILDFNDREKLASIESGKNKILL